MHGNFYFGVCSVLSYSYSYYFSYSDAHTHKQLWKPSLHLLIMSSCFSHANWSVLCTQIPSSFSNTSQLLALLAQTKMHQERQKLDSFTDILGPSPFIIYIMIYNTIIRYWTPGLLVKVVGQGTTLLHVSKTKKQLEN